MPQHWHQFINGPMSRPMPSYRGIPSTPDPRDNDLLEPETSTQPNPHYMVYQSVPSVNAFF